MEVFVAHDKQGNIVQINAIHEGIEYMYVPNDDYAYAVINGQLDFRIKCKSFTELTIKILRKEFK
jgi:hypothetical protein